MICFKDQTFCAARCRNDTCQRNFTDELHQQAREWWGHSPDNAPVAMTDYSPTCKDYQP